MNEHIQQIVPKKMEVCLICTNNIIEIDKTKSVFDIDDENKIQIKDILFDFNYKICIKDTGSDSICYDCYVELLKIYKFRDECCILFNCEEDFVSCCQLCLEETDDFKLLSDSVLINNESSTVLEILNKICSYDLSDKYDDGEEYLCKTCFKACLDNYPFYLKCEKATEYWDNFILKKNTQIRASSCFDFSITEGNSAIVEIEESAQIDDDEPDRDYCGSDPDYHESMTSSNDVHNSEVFHCYTCMKAFERKTQLIKHIKIHTNNALRKTEKQTSVTKKKCTVCSKSFSCGSVLTRHVKTVHTNNYAYKCDLCPKKYKDYSALRKHKFLHKGERPFMCEKCSKTFTCSGHLTSHSLTHLEEKSHECDVCSKKFTYKRLLVLHKRNHSDIRPYKCDLCPKAFRRNGDLSIHKTIHNTERRFKCTTCSKTFSSKHNLLRHEKLHFLRKSHKCQLCLKEFNTADNLKQHIKKTVCNNKDKFICEFCSKEFSLLRALQLHRKIVHINDEKTVNNGPFSCDICKKEYKLLRILKIHMGMTHNKKN